MSDETLAFAIRRANNACDTEADFLASDWLARRDEKRDRGTAGKVVERVEAVAEVIYLAAIETHEDQWPTWEYADDGWREFAMNTAREALAAALAERND